MKRVELRASWTDGEAFRGLWAPIDGAEEFLLISCYVSDPAWEALERTLREHLKRPSFHCTLVFSLAGLAATAARAVIERLALLMKEHPPSDRVRAFVMNDHDSALFHPKAHGSMVGGRSKVVVGSASLTTAAAQRNYEMMAIIEDDLDAYQSLRQAINGLGSSKLVQITEETIQDLRDSISAHVARDRAISPHRDKRTQQLMLRDFEPRNYDALLPPDSTHTQALLAVRALLCRGGFVVRVDKLEPLMVSVPLTPFRDAKLLATPQIQDLGAGVSYETSGGSSTFSLILKGLREDLDKITRPLGRLIGRFSIECLGGLWMPLAWDETFLWHWENIASRVWFQEAEAKVADHLRQLSVELGPNGALRARLGKQLEVLDPAQWIESSVKRLLHWDRNKSMPSSLGPALREEVVNAVLEHIHETVKRRLSSSFVIAQLHRVGRMPHFRQRALDTHTPVDALLFLSEWTMAGVVPRLRSSSGEFTHAPGRSGVAQVLAEKFDISQATPESVFETALLWQKVAISGGTEQEICQTLADAWTKFVRWYGLTPEHIDWKARIPPWSSGVDKETAPSPSEDDGPSFWPT